MVTNKWSAGMKVYMNPGASPHISLHDVIQRQEVLTAGEGGVGFLGLTRAEPPWELKTDHLKQQPRYLASITPHKFKSESHKEVSAHLCSLRTKPNRQAVGTTSGSTGR